MTPTPGMTGDLTLSVKAAATEQANQSAAVAAGTLTISIEQVIPQYVYATDVVVNDGQAQRSMIWQVAIAFSEQIWSQDLATDIEIVPIGQKPLPLTLNRFTYGPEVFTVTIDLTGVVLANRFYAIAPHTDGITSWSIAWRPRPA